MLERACCFLLVSVFGFCVSCCLLACSCSCRRVGRVGVLGVLACWRVGRVSVLGVLSVLSVLGANLSRSISDRPPEIHSVICQLRMAMLVAVVCDIFSEQASR